MKTIQILGPGCFKCETLAKHADQAAKELGIQYQIEKVTDILRITDFGVLTTPGLVVDGEVKVVGRVPSVEEVKKLIL